MCEHDGFAYAGKIDDTLSSVTNLFSADFMPDLTPFGIAANDDQLIWGTYGISRWTSEPIYYFMSLANDNTLSAATPICLFEYNHDSSKTDNSHFTPKMVTIDSFNDFYMVGEDRGGLGRVMVLSLPNSSNSKLVCSNTVTFLMLEHSGKYLTYRSFYHDVIEVREGA